MSITSLATAVVPTSCPSWCWN